MDIKFIPLLIGIVLIALKWYKFIIINNWWIVLCFVIWFILFYISIHRKNKDRQTPRPVYLTNQQEY